MQMHNDEIFEKMSAENIVINILFGILFITSLLLIASIPYSVVLVGGFTLLGVYLLAFLSIVHNISIILNLSDGILNIHEYCFSNRVKIHDDLIALLPFMYFIDFIRKPKIIKEAEIRYQVQKRNK